MFIIVCVPKKAFNHRRYGVIESSQPFLKFERCAQQIWIYNGYKIGLYIFIIPYSEYINEKENYHFVTYGKVLRGINCWFTNIKLQTYIPMYTRCLYRNLFSFSVCVTNNNHTQLETFISPSWTKHPNIHTYIKMILPNNCATFGMNAPENFK